MVEKKGNFSFFFLHASSKQKQHFLRECFLLGVRWNTNTFVTGILGYRNAHEIAMYSIG